MGYYSSLIVLIPAIIFTMIVQARIKSAYNTYSQVPNSSGITGGEAARMVLMANGLTDVTVNVLQTDGLTDYYDPRNNSVNLSRDIYGADSVAAVSIACHEVGHAIQHARGYFPVKLRNALVPIVNFTSNLAWPLIVIGLIMTGFSQYSDLIFNIGVICYVAVVIFHLVTLPVEFNASSRALQQMRQLNIVDNSDYSGSRKVLHAAAMTYVAALAVAAATLLRILLIRGRRD